VRRLLGILGLTLPLWLASVSIATAKTPEIQEFTLENGLHVIVVQDKRIPAISHNLLMRLGAADDPHGKSGLAHYLEHMLFQGTEKYAPNEYSKIVAAHGGKTNAFTTADYTGYWVNITKEHLPLVMELEADRLQHLNPPQQDFTNEQKVILEERSMRVDNNPSALFAEQFDALLYYHHPYGTPIIGWKNEMEALNRDDVMAYFHRFYQPRNMVLVVSGDVLPETVKEMAETHYGPLENKGEAAPTRMVEPPQLGPRRFEMTHPQVKQPYWQRVVLAPGYNWPQPYASLAKDKDSAAYASQIRNILPLMVAEHLLGGSKTSRLYRALVENEKIATDISVSYNAFRMGPGEFGVYVTPRNASDIPAIEKRVNEELQKLRNTPPSAEEVARAKTQLIASNVYLRDGLQSLAKVMGHLAMIGLPLDYYFNWEAEINAVTPQQVAESLGALKPNYSVTGTLLPEPKSIAAGAQKPAAEKPSIAQ